MLLIAVWKFVTNMNTEELTKLFSFIRTLILQQQLISYRINNNNNNSIQ